MIFIFYFGFLLFSIFLCSNIENENISKIKDSSSTKAEKPSPKSSLRFKALFSDRIFESNPLTLAFLSRKLPNEIGEMIAGWDHDKGIQDAYEIVINKLELSHREREKLNFYSNDFLGKLFSIVEKKKTEFSNNNLFWNELERLLLKVILHLNQKKINPSSPTFKEALKNIQNINSIIQEKSDSSSIPSNLDFENLEFSKFDIYLLDSEFFYHSSHLALRFADALEYFYSPLLSSIKDEEVKNEITCEKFQIKFSINGNSNDNPLFEAFIVKYDIEKQMKNCLLYNLEPNYSRLPDDSTNRVKRITELINDLRESKSIECLIDNPSMEFASKSIMKSIFLNKRTVPIVGNANLYKFLQRMKDVDLLKNENIQAIARFKFSSPDPNNWDLGLYRTYLEEYSRKSIPIKEREFINECLELFNPSSLGSNPAE